MKTKIYVVTTGEYSDFHIVAMFSTMKRAERSTTKFEKHADYTGYDIQEYTLNPVPDKIYVENLNYYDVTMYKDGRIRGIIDESDPTYIEEEVWGSIRKPIFNVWDTNGEIAMRVHCWAKSPEHAIKIVNEKRTQLIANGMWGYHE